MGGRPRTPTNVLKLGSAPKNHPERLKDRENEPVNKNPIGRPPTWLGKDERRAWRMIVKECIDGVLGEADRLAVAVASQIAAKCMMGEADHQDRTLLLRYLGQFGMTPSERTKIAVPKEKPKSRFR